MSKGWRDRLRAWLGGTREISDEWRELRSGLAAVRARRGQRTGTVAEACQVAERTLGLRPYDEQVLAALAIDRGRLVEMATGEGKTLAAALAVVPNALEGAGVHVLTFNDYLARRDAAWMMPVYEHFGLSVGVVQQQMTDEARRDAWAADVTYATAKQAGFDFLRDQLACEPSQCVQRPFRLAIVDEADSILIDEARVPLVIAAERDRSTTDPYRLADLVATLAPTRDYTIDDGARNAMLTDEGLSRLETALDRGELHQPDNEALLVELHQALHARALLQRDVDYIVRDETIELVDAFTGRVVADRRWPDGLQEAVEARERLPIRPGGRILGSIAIQHYLRRYPRLAGMTATAASAEQELAECYGLRVVPIPPHRPCRREDAPPRIFPDRVQKLRAVVERIATEHVTGRPILVGTASVDESETLGSALTHAGIDCRILNARNDEHEAAIVAAAGRRGAVTISTNMAGRGTDIRLGADVAALGGLLVIGTQRHESRRIDEQLRGRAGRQGDPGASCFYVSLDDTLMQQHPPSIDADAGKEIDRIQRIVEGQNHEIRTTLARYSHLIEEQRQDLQGWRRRVLGGEDLGRLPLRHAHLDPAIVNEARRRIALHEIDRGWETHLAFVAELREGIHLLRIGGIEPLDAFGRRVVTAFHGLRATIEERIAERLETIDLGPEGIDLDGEGLVAPSSTWTYLVSDRPSPGMHETLVGSANFAFAGVGALTLGPLIFGEAVARKIKRDDPE